MSLIVEATDIWSHRYLVEGLDKITEIVMIQ